jgi:hypothetical protein
MGRNKFFEHSYLFRERHNQLQEAGQPSLLNEGPKLLKAEAVRRGAAGSQSAIFQDNDRRWKKWDTEKDGRNKANKYGANICCIYLPLGNRANETEMAIAGAWMNQAMRDVTDGKKPGEEQQDSEQTRECGICDPLRANRFSSFLQAEAIKHEACPRASVK